MAAALAVAVILAWNLSLRHAISDGDEGAWIFSTYYYRLAFRQGDFSSPDWSHEDAYDHPPLAKYYIGAFLLGYEVPDSLAAKEWWFQHAYPPFDRRDFLSQLRGLIPMETLQRARLASTIAVGAACAGAFLLATSLLPTGLAAFAGLVVALLPLSRLIAGQALSDGLFAGLLTLSAASQARLAADIGESRRKVGGLVALSGMLIGLAFDTKISGAVELAIAPAALLAAAEARHWRRALGGGIGMVLAAAATALAANPSLWRSPYSFVAGMIHHRREMLAFQQVVYSKAIHPSLIYRLAEAFKALFGLAEAAKISLLFQATGLLSAFLAILGIWGLPPRLRDRMPEGRATRSLAIHAAGWAVAAVATYVMHWDHYLFPAVPFLCVLAAAGLDDILSSTARRPAMIAKAAAITLAFALASYPLSTEEYWTARPDEHRQRLNAAIERLCADYPDKCSIVKGARLAQEPLGSGDQGGPPSSR